MGCGCSEKEKKNIMSDIKTILKKRANIHKKILRELNRPPSVEDLILDLNDIGMKIDEIKTLKRLEVCLQCDELDKTEGVCGKCGCFVGAKSQISSEHCPIYKW